MSSETENDHSSDKLDSTDSLKGKEVSSWLLNLMSDRVLPLSSHSRINLTMPPIASGIWRKIGHLSPQSIRLPILQRASFPILIKAPSLSTVWRRLLDLPLLRRRQKRTNESTRASQSYTGERWPANVYMSPDEALSNEYSQDMAAIGDEQLASEPVEPSTGEHVQRVPLVAESQPVDAADEVYPTVVDDVPARPADISRELNQADRSDRLAYPSSIIQASEQVISKSRPVDDSKPSLPQIDRATAPESERPGQVQESDLKDFIYAEDIQTGPSLKPQPEYKSQDSADISLSSSTEPDLEIVGRMLPNFNKHLQPVSSSQGLGNVRLPVTEEPVVSSEIVDKPSIAARLSTPLVHSLPVLQRLYLKTRDKAAELGSKVMQLPYTVSKLSTQRAFTPSKEPAPSLDSYEPTSSQPVEDNLTYPLPDRGVPAESEAITCRYQPIDQPVAAGVDKSVPDMLSPTIKKHDANLTTPSSNLISRRLLEVQQPEKSQIQLSPLTLLNRLTPLIEPRVERFKTKKADEDLDSVSQGMETVTPHILPMGEADVPAEFPEPKAEIFYAPLGIPSTTEVHREMLPDSEGNAGIAASSVLKFFRPVRDARVESGVGRNIMRREFKKPVSALSGRIYRSMELLLTSPVKTGTVFDATRIEGVSPGAFRGPMDYISQPISGPASALGRYPETIQSEMPIAQTMRPSETMPPEPSLIQTRRSAEVTLPEIPVVQIKRYTEAVSPEPAFVSERSRTEAVLPELEVVSKKSQTDEISMAAAGTEGVAAEAAGEEEAALDLDAIARDVYRILKRRLYRERERAFGLS